MLRIHLEGNLIVDVLPISLSKGLEFDNVLIYDASEDNYSTERDQKILYTAISRGMKNLFITYKRKLSRLL
ncbi:MAG: ATP-binding domain-containing protein, partial [Carnobacterium sp.]|uniref:ATP-binding domain-containing protein n=1 Tax=Carnobacterium sp. TaxID=48221 RepID=UPI0009E8E954|nr:ATP-binding domain-containing protein [Carnobacterium sp. CS13]